MLRIDCGTDLNAPLAYTLPPEGSAMGLLDQLGSAVAGATGKGAGGGVSALLLQQLIALLGKPGAMEKVLAGFQSSGLGNVLQSWIGTGQNLPISADQVRSVLGQGTVAELAEHAGIGEPDAAQALTGLLPQVIDKLTPQGSLPANLDLGGLASSLGTIIG
jgi:uncharacterized protein YidB (DUF937 family)